jgi:hypothetical protein
MIRRKLYIGLLLVSAPFAVWGQSTGPTSPYAQGPEIFGNGEQRRLNYVGESFPSNIVIFSLDDETGYDDNIFGSKTTRRGDFFSALGPHIAFLRKGGVASRAQRLNFSLDYEPYFLLYRRAGSLDAAIQFVHWDMKYQFSPSFGLRLRDSFGYHTGVYQPHSSKEFLPELASPTSLNGTVITPQGRVLKNETRLDAVYRKSTRTSFDLFGAFLNHRWSHLISGVPLFNVEGVDAGFEYSYRLAPTKTVGVLYLLENLSFGRQLRAVVHSAFFSVALRLPSETALNFFAGPQNTQQHGLFSNSLFAIFGTNATSVGHVGSAGPWSEAVGCNLSKQSDRTVFQISAQRLISDGGGFFQASVINSFIDLSLRRRLVGRWDGIWTLDYARTSALGFESSIRSQTAGFAVEHSLRDRLSARLSYNYVRQRGAGQIPVFADVDRDRVSFGVFCRVGKIPLGR